MLLALEDWAGTLHVPAQPTARIASWVPSVTETLFALGLGDSVVARTGFCVHPRQQVKRVPKIGGTKDPDLARLASLAPTHLVVNVDENRREDVEAARAFVSHVVVTHPVKAAPRRWCASSKARMRDSSMPRGDFGASLSSTSSGDVHG
jgi:ABC-type Fe3+-hydroxamate transport system substrate-binding protein